MRKDKTRTTELMVYDLLQAHLPGDCSAVYSAEWICSFRGVERDLIRDPLTEARPAADLYPLGEIDFILVAPGGLLVIEVKGGELTVEGGAWLRKDGWGHHALKESPLVQARRNMFALVKTLQNSRRFYNKKLMTGYAVVLPHTPAWHQQVNPGFPRQLFVFSEEVNQRIVERLQAILGFWAQTWGFQEILSGDDMKAVISVFAPTVQLRRPQWRKTLEAFQTQVLELTESQFDLLRSLSRNRKAVITGGAGTGKTLLAMEKARQSARQGHRTLFTCANRLLARHVREQLAGMENLEVMNFHELCYTWGRRAGIENLTDPDGPERHQLPQAYYDEVLPGALVDAAAVVSHHYDAIIVDEAQEMTDLFWTALQFCFADEEQAIFYIFFDPDQSIWNLKERLPFEEPCFWLTKNLRNSVDIFQRIKPLCGDAEYEPGCTERGRFRIVLPGGASGDLAEELAPLLEELVGEEKIPLRDITILTGRSRNRSQLAAVERVGRYPLTRELQDAGEKILFSSIRQFRGMESPVVILVELDYIVDLAKLRQELKGRAAPLGEAQLDTIARETLLIGISRAQHTLYILADTGTAGKLKQMGLGAE